MAERGVFVEARMDAIGARIGAWVRLASAMAPSGRGRQRGQGVVEYGIILGLSALLAVAILVLFGPTVADMVQWIGRTVDATTGGR
jgi:Flp pilus assembly pilin Flp